MPSTTGEVAIVTGAGGGMGSAIATLLAGQGARLVLNDRSRRRLGSTEAAIREIGGDVLSLPGDVTDPASAMEVIGAALDTWERVDVLVNVVGGIVGPITAPLWEITDEDWQATIRLNLDGTFHCIRAAARPMMAQRHGKIVNIASVGWAGEAAHAHYAVAKAGVVALTRSAATQLGPYDVNVNAVAPGFTGRNVAVDLPGPIEVSVSQTGPLGRANEPGDIAQAVVFLTSENARNISGELLTVAGGNVPHL